MIIDGGAAGSDLDGLGWTHIDAASSAGTQILIDAVGHQSPPCHLLGEGTGTREASRPHREVALCSACTPGPVGLTASPPCVFIDALEYIVGRMFWAVKNIAGTQGLDARRAPAYHQASIDGLGIEGRGVSRMGPTSRECRNGIIWKE